MPQLQDLAIDPLSLGIGVGIGALMVGIAYVWRSGGLSRQNAALEARLEAERAGLEDSFKVLAQSVLQSNNENFLTLAQERLKAANADGAHALDKKSLEIQKMVEPVQQHLQRMNSMVEQLQATDKTIRDDLQNLHKETSKLSGVLRNPSAQGKWGEFVLEAILEKANLQKGTHYETQVAIDGGRPDVVINLHDGFRIAIDSKAPINEYVSRLDEDLSEDDIKSIKNNMARAVRNHVKQLGSRSYQDNVKGTDFVILFLPSEVVFSATLQSDPSIVDYASENNVVIASPTLIISLLRVVGLSWRQVEMAKNAADISALGAELHKRLCKFMEHFAKVGKGINAAVTGYNEAVGSFESKVEPQARKFQKYNVIAKNAEFPAVPRLESVPRPVNLLSGKEEEIDFEADNDDKVGHG